MYATIYHNSNLGGSTLWTKINHQFYRIGYLRAARELERLGYSKEARSCIEELHKL